MLEKLADLSRRIGSLMLACLAALFGTMNWRPPAWLSHCQNALGKLWHSAKAKPLISSSVFMLACGLAAVTWYGYHWWQNRPQPVLIDFAVTAPERTAIEKDELPHPLIIIFNASVAPLEQVGKEISQGLTMKPAVSGRWLWTDDKTLVFRPENDWPVGSVHEVDFEDSLVAEQIVLARTRFEFSTAHLLLPWKRANFFRIRSIQA